MLYKPTGRIRYNGDNIYESKNKNMDTNYSLLQDLYLCVSATRPKNMDNLLIFLDQMMDIEKDVWEE